MLQSITETCVEQSFYVLTTRAVHDQNGDQLIWKADLNTTFLYIISTFKEGRRIRGIKKRRAPRHERQGEQERVLTLEKTPQAPVLRELASLAQDKDFTALLGKLLQGQAGPVISNLKHNNKHICILVCTLMPVEISYFIYASTTVDILNIFT